MTILQLQEKVEAVKVHEDESTQNSRLLTELPGRDDQLENEIPLTKFALGRLDRLRATASM